MIFNVCFGKKWSGGLDIGIEKWRINSVLVDIINDLLNQNEKWLKTNQNSYSLSILLPRFVQQDHFKRMNLYMKGKCHLFKCNILTKLSLAFLNWFFMQFIKVNQSERWILQNSILDWTWIIVSSDGIIN